MESICQELLQFMQLSTRLEIKLTATKNVLGLTGSPEGRKFITDNNDLLEAILILTKDSNLLVAEDCYLSLINLSTEEHAVKFMVENYNILPEFIKIICNPESKYAEKVCMIVSNLTRTAMGCDKFMEIISSSKDLSLSTLLDVFCNINYNKHKVSLDYLGTILANLSQVPEGRNFFLDRKKGNIQRLFSFLQYDGSTIRRGGIASVLRNCCFDYESHKWLLSDEIDILSHLLLPLAGPEEFDDDDTEKLPIDLQYLPADKAREPDEDIRKLLIESLILLCATLHGRNYIKSKNTYVIIRELHQWETAKNFSVEDTEKLIQILISDETDVDNLMTYDIPDEHQKILNAS